MLSTTESRETTREDNVTQKWKQDGWKIKEEFEGGFFKSRLMSIRVELIASKATNQNGAALATGYTELTVPSISVYLHVPVPGVLSMNSICMNE